MDSVTFLALAGGLALLAWSPAKRHFLSALTGAGLLMALSWMGWKDLAALTVFLPAPYLSARALWGRKDMKPGALVTGVVIWQLFAFVVIKRYAWVDILGWLDHPVAVIGVSYILFRQIHLVVDARFLGHLPFSLTRYIAYILSPWTLVAGPIQRYEAFCHGVENVGPPNTEGLLDGAHRAVNGLLRAFVLAPLFLEPSRVTNLGHPDATWIDFLVVLYGFPAYLYLNFAGYTDLMIGAAKLCGFSNLPENFNHPYLARNTRDFWNRWHISFGVWVKHYVFTPLSTRLIKATEPKWHGLMMVVTVLAAFYVVGAWHGTTLNYVIFGIVQGVGVIASAAFENWRKSFLGRTKAKELNQRPWFQAVCILVTLHYTCLCMILLNSDLDTVMKSFTLFLGSEEGG